MQGDATEEPVAEEAALTLSDDVLASAYNGAVTVLKSEIQDEYDQMLSQYVAYYAQYGYSVDEYDTELQASVAQETVQTKLSTSIVRHYAAQNGYELTEEKKTELAALMPVLFNGVIVGAVVHFCYSPAIALPLCMLSVAAGEAVACLVVGPLLIGVLRRVPASVLN